MLSRLIAREADRPARGRAHVVRADVLPALALTAFLCAVTPLALADGKSEASVDAGAFALCLAAGGGFVVRRRLPLATYALALACTVVFVLAYDGGPIFVAALLGMLNVVVCRPRQVWLPAAAGGTVVLLAAEIAAEGLSFAVLVIAVVWMGAAVACGEIVRLRRVEMAEAHARAELAERSREDEALRRMAEERLRIAREVHDVVGHGLAAISLQAGVAEHLLDRRPEEALKAVAAIRQVSKDALEELRAEIGALRDGSRAEGAPRRPAPQLDALDRLVATMGEAGLDVELDVAGNRNPPTPAAPEAVQRAGYRIVQEALTNVARHAGAGAHASVRVAQHDGGIEVEVLDDGAGAANGVVEGNGLAGMRERAAALGGTFEAGGRPEGGFRVWAGLPGGHA